jgi:hypothetical protein
LLICADSAAFICLVSTQITGNPLPMRCTAVAIRIPPASRQSAQ